MSVLDNYLENGNITEDFIGVCVESILPSRTDCSSLIIAPLPATLPVLSNIVANKVYQLTSLNTAAALIGTNSVAYQALDDALCSCKTGRTAIHMVFLPVLASAVAQVASFETSDIVSTHYKTISIGSTQKAVLFASGMTAAAAAAAIQAAFSPVASFPHTIVAASNVVTITAKDKGLYDPYFNMSYEDSRRAPNVVDSPLTNYTVVTAAAGGLDASGLNQSLGRCCFACTPLVSADYATMKAVYNVWNSRNNVCYGSNCFGSLYLAIKGDITEMEMFGIQGDAGASWNVKAVTLGLGKTSRFSPYQIAVARAISSCCRACDDPANPVLNNDSIMDCLNERGDCYNEISSADFKALWDAGITPVVNINGYLGIKRERFSYRFDANNKRINTIESPADFRVMAKYVMLVEEFVLNTFGSNYVFSKNTPIVRGDIFANLPAAMKRNTGWNMNEVRGLWKNFHEQLVGIIFDEQDFDPKLQAFLDDQIRAACAGDPTALVLIGDKLNRVRAISRVRVGVSLTTSSC